MKKITWYQCEKCKSEYSKEEKAIECEESHVYIDIKPWWFIPLVGWFMFMYVNIKYKAPLIKASRNAQDFILLGPILAFCVFMIIYMKFFFH